MQSIVHVEQRSFGFLGLTEGEIRVLYQLVNLSNVCLREKLECDSHSWNGHLDLEAAVEAGVSLRDMLHTMIHGQ